MYKNLHIDSVERNGVGIFRVLNWQAFTGVCLPLRVVLLGKEPKVMFISLMQEKRNQRVHYPQGPLHRGMQPLLLSLLH